MSQSTLTFARPGRSTKQTPAAKSSFRPDIQGLRAVAVLAVIADHLLGYPAGGFVGVDIFFVISGFLITGLLLREQEKKGRISFADFYRRRVRRIVPVAVIVLIVTVATSWGLFSATRAKSITWDGLYALIFGANWHLAAVGTDYMQAGGPVSPLQHFWSLAVEEQFYVVWPWLIVLVLGVLAHRMSLTNGAARRLLAGIFALVIVATFVYAVWETQTHPTVSYFSTLSRTWELAIGALLAVVGGAFSRLSVGMRTGLGYLGLAGIAWSLWFITSEMAFPGPWAAVPVLSTALVIAAGTGGEQRYMYPLTNPVSGYIGNISYSLYLWHFPVIILLESVIKQGDTIAWTAMILLMLALSIASYHFIEDPVRKSAWLEPARRSARRNGREALLSPAAGAIAVGVLALVTASAVLLAVTRPMAVADAGMFEPAPLNISGDIAAVAPDPVTTPEGKLSGDVTAALASLEWPVLEPSLDALGDNARVPEWWEDGCLAQDKAKLGNAIENAEHCVYGDQAATKTAVVIGDSVAISYVPAVRAALEPLGYQIKVRTMAQCPFASVPVVKGDGSVHTECDTFRDWTLDEVASESPDIVIATSALGTLDRLSSEAADEAAQAEWVTGLQTSLNRASAAQRVVWVDPPPGGKPLLECATRVSKPVDCVASVSQEYLDFTRATRTASATGEASNVSMIDSKAWFCSEQNKCPAFVGTSPMFADGAHLTANYSSSLGEVVRPVLTGEK